MSPPSRFLIPVSVGGPGSRETHREQLEVERVLCEHGQVCIFLPPSVRERGYIRLPVETLHEMARYGEGR